MPAALRRVLFDVWGSSLLVAGALIVAGFGSFALAWRGAARTIVVQDQIAFLVSGGLGGLALIALGAGLGTVQLSRLWAARERAKLDAIVATAVVVLERAERPLTDRRAGMRPRGSVP